MHHVVSRLCAVAAALALAGCGSSTSPPAAGAVASASYPRKAVVHWASFSSWNDSMVRDAAEADMMILPIQFCYSIESRGVLSEIRDLNPDIQVIAYQSVMNVLTLYPDTAYLRTNLPYTLDFYNAVRPDWAWTTAGDTLMMWKDMIVLNPIKNGAVNEDLIDVMVDLIARYQDESGAPIDGILHDYFSTYPYINPYVRPGVLGDIDFDGDGVVFDDDPDEQRMYYQWQIDYVDAIRERLGPEFIQIGNGRPPQEDAALARRLNGIFYELYPNNPWGKTDRSGLLRLLENQQPGYLTPAKGRTWSVCTNEKGNANYNNIFCLLSSLIAGCMYTELEGAYLFSGWTLDVDAGAPAGPATTEGALDSTLTVRRPFQNGEVRLSFYDTGRREEYVFEASAPPR
jgi:hypothetical protein